MERPPYLAFGRWLESAIYARGMKRKAFAEKAGASLTSTSNWLNGWTRPFKGNCFAIAEALELDANAVLVAAGYPAAPTPPPPVSEGRWINGAWVRPATAEERQELAASIAELERVFAEAGRVVAEAGPVLAGARRIIEREV